MKEPESPSLTNAMSYKIDFEEHPKFLHFSVSGKNGVDTVASYMRDILWVCRKKDCYRVLIEEHLEGPRLTTLDIFTVASDGAAGAIGLFTAIAYVDEAMDDEMSYFAETVAVNRGIPVRVFPSSDLAQEWLLDQLSTDHR